MILFYWNWAFHLLKSEFAWMGSTLIFGHMWLGIRHSVYHFLFNIVFQLLVSMDGFFWHVDRNTHVFISTYFVACDIVGDNFPISTHFDLMNNKERASRMRHVRLIIWKDLCERNCFLCHSFVCVPSWLLV